MQSKKEVFGQSGETPDGLKNPVRDRERGWGEGQGGVEGVNLSLVDYTKGTGDK